MHFLVILSLDVQWFKDSFIDLSRHHYILSEYLRRHFVPPTAVII